MLTIALLSFCFSLSAQEYNDVLYLKSGKVVRGLITEVKTGEYIKILTSSQEAFIYNIGEILETYKDIEADNRQKQAIPELSRPKGYFGIVKYTFPYFKVDMDFINGYRFSEKFAAGIGMGLKVYDKKNIGLPLYIHLRKEFSSSGFCPFLAWDSGVKIVFHQRCYPYFSQQAGIGFRISRGFRMTGALELPFVYTGKISCSPGLSIGFCF